MPCKLIAAWLPTYGGVALVVPDRDGQDGAKTAHHKALEAIDFRFKQDSAL